MPAQNKNFLKFLEKVQDIEGDYSGVNIWITRINEKPFFNDIKDIEISYERWSNITDVFDIISELKEEFKPIKKIKIEITKGMSYDEPDSDDEFDDDDNLSVKTEDPCEL